MPRLLLAVVLALPVAASAQQLKSEEDKTLYTMGAMLGGRVAGMGLKPNEVETVKRGFTDAALGKKLQVQMQDYGPRVQAFAEKRTSAVSGVGAEKAKTAGRAYAENAAKESGAQRLPSGIVMKTLKPGDGPSPQATDKVKVNYEGRLTDGTVFDSSYKRGQPAEFALNQVIKCWTEGVQKIKVGEKAQLVCPSDVAYGDRGNPPTIPGGSTLVFDVELLGINK